MLFTEIAKALQVQLQTNMPQIRVVLKKNPAMAYTLITKLGGEVGEKYGVKIIVNFPGRERINEFDMYGRRDISIYHGLDLQNCPVDTCNRRGHERWNSKNGRSHGGQTI